MSARFWKVHEINFLLADLFEDHSPQPADESQREFFFGQEEQIDISSLCRIVCARSKEQQFGVGHQGLHRFFNTGNGRRGESHGEEWRGEANLNTCPSGRELLWAEAGAGLWPGHASGDIGNFF